MKHFFGSVFKHHTTEEAEKIFIAGTKETTPSPDDISDDWQRPWLFSRVLVFFGIVVGLLYFLSTTLGEESGEKAIPSFIVFGAIAVPFSGIIFFFETNSYRNISIYKTLQIFLIGGALSLIVTLLIDEIIPQAPSYGDYLTFLNALETGFAEEIAKFLIAIYFAQRFKVKHILEAILVGASVGGGFATMETAGYVYASLFEKNGSVVQTLLVRAFLAPGGHLVWAAISLGGLYLVSPKVKHSLEDFVNPKSLIMKIGGRTKSMLWKQSM
ncbi:PrsW family glutamic-type intramembrane protease [Limosilactobacillus sp.]|uniref:PrsW family glutamic-type intramembrane protease n=1 Tax=Limosilactobacillus sp. TaxID=2773925 RepID=UPI00345EAE87